MHDKTVFAKPPQEGYLSLEQIRITLKIQEHGQIRKIGNRIGFKQIDNGCKYEL